MDTVKILHCGDLHFDTPFQGFTPVEAEKRKEDLRETFGKIIDIVKAQRIPILLMAGDIFDNDGVSKMTMDYIDKKLREIPNTKVFISPGNHDYYSSKSFYSIYSWPSNVHIFKEQLEKIALPELNACVYGIGFSKRHEKQSIINDISVEVNFLNIMVVHGDVISNGQTSEYNPITEVDIKNTNMDYLALGHKHSFSGIRKAGQTYWAYCGNPEGRGFDELGTKGVVVGEVGKNWCDLNFIETSKRKYYVVDVDISEVLNNEEIVTKIKEKTNGLDKHKNLFKIILSGEIDKDLSINTTVLEGKLDDEFYFIKIQDKTTISVNYADLEKEYSLKGIYSRKIREKMLDSLEYENIGLLEDALKMGLFVLDKGKVNIE